MFDRALHNRWIRLSMCVIGAFIMAMATNLFIVPHNLYNGGLLGFSQLIRSILTQKLGIVMGFDFSGILYLLLNVPLLWMAWKNLGRSFVVRTLICTGCCSLFLTLIPVMEQPIIQERLTSCLLGGIVGGFAGGMLLTCGCSSGGLDILGLCVSKKKKSSTVGRFNTTCNVVLYSLCLVLFDASTAIYSAIYTVFYGLFLDRLHKQGITVEVLIITKEKNPELPKYIMDKLDRGVTYWDASGAYTGDSVRVMCVCLNKYEIEKLKTVMAELDPHAFFIVQEGVQAGGNFKKHLEE